MLRIGIVLTGCGSLDGTDAREAVLCALAARRRAMKVAWFAPPGAQARVVDHATAATVEEASPRERLSEAARLAGGAVLPFDSLHAGDVGALLVPGGVGVLDTFFRDVLVPGRAPELRAEHLQIFSALLARGVPLGLVGTAHALIGPLFGGGSFDPFAVPAGEVRSARAAGWAWTPGTMGAGGDLERASGGIERLLEEIAAMAGDGGSPRKRSAVPPGRPEGETG